MDFQQRIAILEKDSWFSTLPPELKQQLAALKTRHYKNGELIHAKGEQARGLFGILTGQARVCTVAANGKELLLTVLGPGHWFGITSALDSEPHTHDVFAVGETELLRMPQNEFLKMLERTPHTAIHFARWTALQLRRVFQGVEDTSLLNMEGLLAKRILNLVSVDYSPEALNSSNIKVQLSQSEMASLLGTTRQSISKQLKSWEIEGYIEVGYGHITLHQVDKLKALFS